MKKAAAVVSALTVLLATAAAMAADTCEVKFSAVIGGFCSAPGGDTVVFLDTGADTDTQPGHLTLQCSVGVVPIVTASGNGPGPDYDFSGELTSGGNLIPFTAVWTSQPAGVGLGTNILWTFNATATGMQSVPPGTYEGGITFTITP